MEPYTDERKVVEGRIKQFENGIAELSIEILNTETLLKSLNKRRDATEGALLECKERLKYIISREKPL